MFKLFQRQTIENVVYISISSIFVTLYLEFDTFSVGLATFLILTANIPHVPPCIKQSPLWHLQFC